MSTQGLNDITCLIYKRKLLTSSNHSVQNLLVSLSVEKPEFNINNAVYWNTDEGLCKQRAEVLVLAAGI